MPRKFISYIFCLFLLIAFSSAASGELLLAGIGNASFAFVSSDDADSLPAPDHTPGALQRGPRAKAPPRSFTGSTAATHTVCLRRWTRETFDPLPLSKPELYQQLSVYRL